MIVTITSTDKEGNHAPFGTTVIAYGTGFGAEQGDGLTQTVLKEQNQLFLQLVNQIT